MKLIVGTESTWSLRAIVCAFLAEIEFEVEVIDLTKPDYKNQIKKHSPVGLVPVLIQEELTIYDSLAIAEFFNELSGCSLYPNDEKNRAKARSLCCELHAGFSNLRRMCPFSLGSVEPLLNPSSALTEEIERIEDIFSLASLPFMFSGPGIVDAFYAVLAYRIKSYGINLDGKAGEYQRSLVNWALLNQAIDSIKI